MSEEIKIILAGGPSSGKSMFMLALPTLSNEGTMNVKFDNVQRAVQGSLPETAQRLEQRATFTAQDNTGVHALSFRVNFVDNPGRGFLRISQDYGNDTVVKDILDSMGSADFMIFMLDIADLLMGNSSYKDRAEEEDQVRVLENTFRHLPNRFGLVNTVTAFCVPKIDGKNQDLVQKLGDLQNILLDLEGQVSRGEIFEDRRFIDIGINDPQITELKIDFRVVEIDTIWENELYRLKVKNGIPTYLTLARVSAWRIEDVQNWLNEKLANTAELNDKDRLKTLRSWESADISRQIEEKFPQIFATINAYYAPEMREFFTISSVGEGTIAGLGGRPINIGKVFQLIIRRIEPKRQSKRKVPAWLKSYSLRQRQKQHKNYG